MSGTQMVSAAVMAAAVGLLAGWLCGWVARGEQNGLFLRNQLRLAELRAREAVAPVAAEVALPAAQTVVHVHLQMPPSLREPTLDVIDGQVVRELEGR